MIAAQRCRVLFLGCGEVTRMHSRTLRRIGGVDLYYASRDAERAQAFRAEFGGAGAFGSYERAVTHDVDVVVVATPPASHRALALAALDAGKHVILEKPAFPRSSDTDAVRNRSEALGLRVMVAENYAYKPIIERLTDLVGSGALGEIRFVTINATKWQPMKGWRADPRQGGGDPLLEGGIHWVSFAASLGLDITGAWCRAVGDLSTLLVLEYANGAVGTIAHSWEMRAPLGGLRMSKIQGTRGAVTFESNGIAMAVTGRRKRVALPGVVDLTGTRAMWRDFLWALRTGARTRYTLAMAQRDIRIIEAARRGSLLHSLELDDEHEGAVRGNLSAAVGSVAV